MRTKSAVSGLAEIALDLMARAEKAEAQVAALREALETLLNETGYVEVLSRPKTQAAYDAGWQVLADTAPAAEAHDNQVEDQLLDEIEAAGWHKVYDSGMTADLRELAASLRAARKARNGS
jgi:hypothetical protein